MNRDTGEGDKEYPGIHDRVKWTGVQDKGIGSTQGYRIGWSEQGYRIGWSEQGYRRRG